jgi:hypothetical protein
MMSEKVGPRDVSRILARDNCIAFHDRRNRPVMVLVKESSDRRVAWAIRLVRWLCGPGWFPGHLESR